MTRFHYISPSVLPSRYANSIHVVLQCDGLVRAGVDVSLYAKRSEVESINLPSLIDKIYGVDSSTWSLITYYSRYSLGINLRIALIALKPLLEAAPEDIVLSRNLYAAWLFSSIGRPIIYETHQLEYGIRKAMQKSIITRPWVQTVAISNSLVKCLEEHHELKLKSPLVLHDAAPEGIKRLNPQNRRKSLANLLKINQNDLMGWTVICGYFGSLYVGRGIEIIEAMALARPSALFLIFGGSEFEIEKKRKKSLPNIIFGGHLPHPMARALQASVDILLMPYQRNVSIGISGHDTARWMSPMKMFEYLAAGVPIISSDLPVLREVLVNQKNSLLVTPEKTSEWLAALDLLVCNNNFANSIGESAHKQYLSQHTWTRRGELLLSAVS